MTSSPTCKHIALLVHLFAYPPLPFLSNSIRRRWPRRIQISGLCMNYFYFHTAIDINQICGRQQSGEGGKIHKVHARLERNNREK